MMMLFFVLNVLVYQNGDTLLFTEQDSIVDQWILGEKIFQTDSGEIKLHKEVKISSNNEKFFIYTEHYGQEELRKTEIVLYNTFRDELWRDVAYEEEVISFRLSNIYDSLLVVVRSLREGTAPMLYTVKDTVKDIIIEEGAWDKIIDYSVSPNRRYLLLHTKNPYAQKSWDYIYFVDLESKKEWQYLFPICASCRRSKITLIVDDEGISEIITKGQHRIFSKDGEFIDYFLRFD
jgi:hypothetical protein